MTTNGDGTYTLLWPQIPDSTVTYAVYSRIITGTIDYTQPPKAIVKQTSWVTSDLSFSKNTCFVVRFVSSQLTDTNTNEVCANNKLLTFAGLSSLKNNNDGTFTLVWEKLATQNVSYAIFSRVPPANYDFTTPDQTAQTNTYNTPDLTFQGNTCFVVRYNKAGAPDDSNMQEICTKTKPLVFAGLGSGIINPDGSVNLSWAKIPETGVSYNIYTTSTSGVYDYTQPFANTSNVTYTFSKYPLDVKNCFVVRYSMANEPADTNTAEDCPALLAYVTDFKGISNATSTQTGVANISWTPSVSSQVAGYNIYLGTGFKTLAASVSSGNSAVVSSLVPDTTYSFGVRAYDSYGREDSNTVTTNVKIANISPPSFGGISSAVKASSSSVTISWLAAGGSPKEYHIYEAVGPSGGSAPSVTLLGATPVAVVPAPATSYTITGLGDDLQYSFVVRAAVSGGQEDANSTALSVTLPDNGAPVFSGIQSAAFAQGAAQITWSAAVGQTTSYYVYYQAGSSLNFTTAQYQIVTNPQPPTAGVTSATINGLQGNQSWTFAVRAVDSHFASDTNTKTMTAVAGSLVPPVFLGYVSALPVSGSQTKLAVTFNRSTEATMSTYNMSARITGSAAAFVQNVSVSQPSGSPATVAATLTGLLPYTSYDLLVKAVDTSGNISTSNQTITATTFNLTLPTFAGITTVAAKTGDSSQTVVSWAAGSSVAGIAGYRVYYSTGSLSGCATALVNTATYPVTPTGCSSAVNISSLAGPSSTSITLGGLTQGSVYYFIAHAIDGTQNEDQNAVQIAYSVPFYVAPAAPTGLTLTPTGPSSNQNPYVSGSGATGNTIRVYVNGALSTSIVITSGTTFNVPVSLPSTSATYAITASQVNQSSVEGNQTAAVNYQLLLANPVATLTGAGAGGAGVPTNAGTSNLTSLNITVGGSSVASYKYSLAASQTTACSNATYNGAWIAVATNITDALGADGIFRLCVVAQDTAGNVQANSSATQIDWTKNTTPPAATTISSIKDPITNSTTQTYTPVVKVTLAAVTGASSYCAKGTSTTPLTSDSCWSSSLTPNATLTSTGTATVYAWAMNAAGTISSSVNATINYTNYCDTGDLSLSCTVSTVHTLPVGGISFGGQGSVVFSNGGKWAGTMGDVFVLTMTGDVTVSSGGIIAGNFTINANNIKVNSGGSINADAIGNSGVVNGVGNGPTSTGGGVGSNTSCANLAGGGGGGSFGAGGIGASYSAGTPGAGGASTSSSCSNLTQPSGASCFGAAGGGSGTAGTNLTAGGAGGGALKLNATTLLTINGGGTVSANGQDAPTSTCATVQPGAGGGGAVWLIGASIAGTGQVAANGGSPTAANVYGGSGGGGRISINSSNAFHGSLSVNGGTPRTWFEAIGQPGNIYVNYSNPCDSGDLTSGCTISGLLIWGSNQDFTVSGNLTIANGGNLAVSAARQKIQIVGDTVNTAIVVQNGGAITANLSDVIGASMNINTGGVVVADGLGDVALSALTSSASSGNGYNAETPANYSLAGGGGGHGGEGGGGSCYWGNGGINAGVQCSGGSQFETGSSGSTNNYAKPVAFGAPGTSTYLTPSGGAGGGAIKISVTTLTVSGTLSANGSVGASVAAITTGGGGGAGGSIYLNVTTLNGAGGTISANGGNGGSSAANGGGGGGGRVASYNTNQYAGAVSANGGLKGGGGAYDGQPGTVYFSNPDNYCSSGSMSGTCTISQTWGLPNNTSLSGVALTITNGGQIWAHQSDKIILTFSGAINVNSGGLIKANASISGASLNIAGSINVDGWGYLGQAATSGATCPTCNGGGVGSGIGGGGGGHGGAGGVNGDGVLAGSANDSASAPIQFGSAGGGNTNFSSYGGAPGSGGGSVYINITGTTTVSSGATISANGTSGTAQIYHYGSGGGAGGSIYIISNTITGSGALTANGGAGSAIGGYNYSGGGGGGGRIKLQVTTDTFTGSGSKTASGGAPGALSGGGSGLAGGAGTIQ